MTFTSSYLQKQSLAPHKKISPFFSLLPITYAECFLFRMKKWILSCLLLVCTTLTFPQTSSLEVLRFSTEVKEEKVYLSWNTSPYSGIILLYRSKKPFTEYASLADAILLSTFHSQITSFTDSPTPGNTYYYALVFEYQILQGLNLNFTAGKNTSASPCYIAPSTANEVIVERPMSLPLLSSSEATENEALYFSDITEHKIQSLNQKFSKYQEYINTVELGESYEPDSFYRFKEERAGTSSALSLSLKQILDTYVDSKNWNTMETKITQFLKLLHPEDITDRAYFYLAECYFFQKKYDVALLTFLRAEKRYKDETEPWVKKVLDKLAQN